MSPSIKISAASLLALLSVQAAAYKVEAYSDLHCEGELQQTIETTESGCQYFDDKAASFLVSGPEDHQWIFFNNFPCNSETQVGSWIGNVCFNQGNTKLKAFSGYIVEGTKAKRDIDTGLEKRAGAGIVETWLNGDCSGSPTNQYAFPNENIPVTLNNVVSIRARDVPSDDIAYACSDSTCKVDSQVVLLENDVCQNVEGENVNSAISIGTPDLEVRNDSLAEHRSPVLQAREAQALEKRADAITCATDNLVAFEDGLQVGDAWQGDNGLACCCHVPGGPSCRTSGTASGCIADSIQCPGDPSGMPPIGACPINCNQMRGYFYSIATECKTADGMTGGVAHAAAGDITLSHS